MNALDIILIIAVAAIVAASVICLVRSRKKGRLCPGCSKCKDGSGCPKCSK